MTALATLPEGARILAATRADTDRKLLASWVDSLGSAHTQRNFEVTGARFLAALKMPMRQATIEDVRDALAVICAGLSLMTARQYILRVKSLLSYGHKLGYTIFNAGAAIKPPKEVRALAKRIVGELDVQHVIRAGQNDRNYLIGALLYASAVRVSEFVSLNVGDVIRRPDGRIQLHVVGKGGKERQVLLPEDPELLGRVLALCAGRPDGVPLFLTRNGRSRMTTRAVHHVVKKLALRAGVNPKLSPHWLRHAHASHAHQRGESLASIGATLGHANLTTTSDYAHAMPNAASGDKLNPDVWRAPRS